jgi:hypothetical protein
VLALAAGLAGGLALPLTAWAQSAGAGSSNMITYSNPQYGFSLQYPASGRVPVAGLARYEVGAAAGQPLMVSVQSQSLQESLSISGVSDGAHLLDFGHQVYWQGMLRVSEDYLIQVRGGPPGEEFTLDIRAPATVRFGPSECPRR